MVLFSRIGVVERGFPVHEVYIQWIINFFVRKTAFRCFLIENRFIFAATNIAVLFKHCKLFGGKYTLVSLASRASVPREPCKCGSRAVQVWLEGVTSAPAQLKN